MVPLPFEGEQSSNQTMGFSRQQAGRLWIVAGVVGSRPLQARCRIAVAAPEKTGIVHSYIPAGGAPAFFLWQGPWERLSGLRTTSKSGPHRCTLTDLCQMRTNPAPRRRRIFPSRFRGRSPKLYSKAPGFGLSKSTGSVLPCAAASIRARAFR